MDHSALQEMISGFQDASSVLVCADPSTASYARRLAKQQGIAIKATKQSCGGWELAVCQRRRKRKRGR